MLPPKHNSSTASRSFCLHRCVALPEYVRCTNCRQTSPQQHFTMTLCQDAMYMQRWSLFCCLLHARGLACNFRTKAPCARAACLPPSEWQPLPRHFSVAMQATSPRQCGHAVESQCRHMSLIHSMPTVGPKMARAARAGRPMNGCSEASLALSLCLHRPNTGRAYVSS